MNKIFIFISALFLFVACIKTQNDLLMEQEMNKLKTDVNKVKKANENPDTTLRDSVIKHDQEIDDLKAEISLLTGKIEEVSFKSEKINREASESILKEIAALKKEIEELKVKGSTTQAATKSEANEEINEKALYNRAYGNFKQGKLTLALEDFNNLMKKFPNTSYKENAYFFIAESHFGLKKYETAIVEYENVVKKFPKSKRLSLVNYKQGLSFLALESFDDATYFFNQVVNNFPASEEAKLAKKELQNLDKNTKAKKKKTPK